MAETARAIAQLYWDARHRFVFPIGCKLLPGWDALESAVAAATVDAAVLVGDYGDNLTAGGAGDVSHLLGRLCFDNEDASVEVVGAARDGGGTAIGPPVLVAGLVDRAAVVQCVAQFEAGQLHLSKLVVGSGCCGADGGEGGGCEAVRDRTGHIGDGDGSDGAGDGMDVRQTLTLRDVRVLQALTHGAGTATEAQWVVVQTGRVTLILQSKPWAFLAPWDFEKIESAYRPVGADGTAQFAVCILKLGVNLEDVGTALGGAFSRCLLVNGPGATSEPVPTRRHIPATWIIPNDSEVEWVAPLGRRP
jgi:hypothetical protein